MPRGRARSRTHPGRWPSSSRQAYWGTVSASGRSALTALSTSRLQASWQPPSSGPERARTDRAARSFRRSISRMQPSGRPDADGGRRTSRPAVAVNARDHVRTGARQHRRPPHRAWAAEQARATTTTAAATPTDEDQRLGGNGRSCRLPSSGPTLGGGRAVTAAAGQRARGCADTSRGGPVQDSGRRPLETRRGRGRSPQGRRLAAVGRVPLSPDLAGGGFRLPCTRLSRGLRH